MPAEFVVPQPNNTHESASTSAPRAQNFIFDAGLQFRIKEFLTLSTSWEYNAQEVAEDCESWLPSVGLTFRFLFNSKKNNFMKDNGWQQSEVAVSGAYKKMYDHINAVSGGVKLNLGKKDDEAPKIKLFGEK